MNSLWFIEDGPRDGSLNMALDDLLARRIWYSPDEVICRTYMWNKPTLSIGFHQNPKFRIDYNGCRTYGVALARRPTGGRELLHHGDLSFSIAVRMKNTGRGSFQSNKDVFLRVGRMLARAMAAIGIQVDIARGSIRAGSRDTIPCVAATSQYEILSRAKKLVPVAQRIYPASVLIHGSIPLKESDIPTSRLLKTSNAVHLQSLIDKSSTNLFRLLGIEINVGELNRCLRSAFEEEYNGAAITAEVSKEILVEAAQQESVWKE